MRNLKKITNMNLTEKLSKDINNELDNLIKLGFIDEYKLNNILENGEVIPKWTYTSNTFPNRVNRDKYNSLEIFFIDEFIWRDEYDFIGKYVPYEILYTIVDEDRLNEEWNNFLLFLFHQDLLMTLPRHLVYLW